MDAISGGKKYTPLLHPPLILLFNKRRIFSFPHKKIIPFFLLAPSVRTAPGGGFVW